MRSLNFKIPVREDFYTRAGEILGLNISAGDAAANQVLAGVTFTSDDGLKLTGTLVVQRYYTGADTPDNSFGNNGDLYLKV